MSNRKWRRGARRVLWFSLIVSAVLILLWFGWGSLFRTLQSKLEARVEEQLEQALDRDVVVDDVRLAPGGIQLEDVRVPRRASELNDPFKASSVFVGTNLWLLLRTGELRVSSLRIDAAKLHVGGGKAGPPKLKKDDPTKLVKQATELGLERIEVRRSALVVSNKAGTPSVKARGIDLDLRLRDRQLDVQGSATQAQAKEVLAEGAKFEGLIEPEQPSLTFHARTKQIKYRQRAYGELSMSGSLMPGELELTRWRFLATPVKLGGNLRVDWKQGPPQLHAEGRAELDRSAVNWVWQRILPAKKQAVRAELAHLNYQVSGSLEHLEALRVEGEFEIESLAVRTEAMKAPLRITSLSGRFSRSSDGAYTFDALRAKAPGVLAVGEVKLREGQSGQVQHFYARGSVDAQTVARLEQMVPRLTLWQVLRDGGAETRSHFQLQASGKISPEGLVGTTRGRLDVKNVLIRIPRTDGGPTDVGIRRADGQFEYRWRTPKQAFRLSLRDVSFEGPNGNARGSAEMSEAGHRFELIAEDADPEFLNQIIVGQLQRGKMHGTLRVVGDADEPLRHVSGEAEVENTIWTFPEDSPFGEKSVAVRHAATKYAFNEGHFRVRDLKVKSRLSSGEFDISGGPQWTKLWGTLNSLQLGRVTDSFPELYGLLGGGIGHTKLRITWLCGEAKGLVTGTVANAMLNLPSPGGKEPSRYPVSHGSFEYEFSRSKQTLRELTVRGPLVNGNLTLSWDELGRITGGGYAWLTREYTKELAGIWSLPLRLLGYKRLATDFRVYGSESEVRVNADIAHGARWRLLRLGVPEPLRSIARGEKPLIEEKYPDSKQDERREQRTAKLSPCAR